MVALRAALGFGSGFSSVSNKCRVSTKAHGDAKPLKAVNSRASAVVVFSRTRPGRTWHLVRLWELPVTAARHPEVVLRLLDDVCVC